MRAMFRACQLAMLTPLLVVALPDAAGQESATPAESTESPSTTGRVSPRMRALLNAAANRHEAENPPPPSATGRPVADAAPAAPGDPSVVRLPQVIVNENKLPNATEVMSRRALEEYAMNRYLGSKDGLDRGFLNRFTIPELWKKIPILGRLLPAPIGVTNEDRAMQLYHEDLRRQKMNNLLDLGTITTRTGDRELGERIRRETQEAFRK